jgi:DNA repair protein RadC
VQLLMSFEEGRVPADPALWDWGNKESKRISREPRYDPLQLQLPLGVEALRESGLVESYSPDRHLVNLLRLTGVSDPDLVARELASEFASLWDLMAASRPRIRALVGKRVAQAVHTAHELMKAALLERAVAAPLVPRSAALIDFLRAELGCLKHERLLSLYLDAEMRLMSIETIADGDCGQVLLHARKIMTCGLAIGASAFVLVHNHPSGIPEPSAADLAATAQLRRTSAELGLELIDHLIIAREGFGSINDYWREARWKNAGSP